MEDDNMVSVNRSPIKDWSSCSMKERRFIELVLQGKTYDEIANIKINGIQMYAKGSIANKKKELEHAISERMAMLDSSRILSLEQALAQVSDIATNMYDSKDADRLKALDMMIKNKGGYVEKVEVKKEEGITIEIVGGRSEH